MIEVNKSMLYKVDRLPAWKTNCGRKIEQWLQKKCQLLEFGYSCQPGGNMTYMVEDGRQRWEVDLINHVCTCGEWQMTGIPCVHVCRVGKEPRTPSMYSLLEGCYLKGTQELLLQHFVPAVTMHEDPAENLLDQEIDGRELLPKPQPPPFKKRPGRPKVNRIESQPWLKKQKRCADCNMLGHNRRGCRGHRVG